MGASGWSNFIAYDPDVETALKALQAEVFERGEYFWVFDDKPASISDLRQRNESDGTHCIIDVSGVSAKVKEIARGGAFAGGFEDDFDDSQATIISP